MSWMTVAVEAGYDKIDQQVVGSGLAEASLPAPSAVAMDMLTPLPEKIFVQAFSGNTANIMLGYTGVKADGTTGGFELPPGASMYLPHHQYTKWKHIAAAAGQKLLVSYLRRVA